MVRLTLSHVVTFLPLIINQFVSGESYHTRLLHDGSNICREHIRNRSSSTFKKFKNDVNENASLLAPSSSKMEFDIIPYIINPRRSSDLSTNCFSSALVSTLRGGAALSVSIAAFNPFPSGYHPFGYGITDLGRSFLEFDGSIDSDIGKFLSTFKGGAGDGGASGKRKSTSTMKDQWLEIVRVAKTGQSMRIYRRLDNIIAFCIKAGFLD